VSHARLLARKVLGIPSIVLFDYEVVMKMQFLHPDWIFVPEVMPDSGAGVAKRARLRFAAGTREVPKPCKQGCEMRTVLLGQSRELQSKSTTILNMLHDRLGPDLSFRDEKVELCFHSNWSWT
jgi:hypothetical protein